MLFTLCGAGVVEVFALQIYLRAAQMLGQVFGVINRAGTTHIVFEVVIQFGDEFGIVAIFFISLVQFIQRTNQGFRNINTAIRAEVAGAIGIVVHLFS